MSGTDVKESFPYVHDKPDPNRITEAVHPTTGETIKVSARLLKVSLPGIEGRGLIFDEPTAWPASDSIIGLYQCDLCKDYEDREDGGYCKPENLKLELHNSPCQRFIKPEDAEDKRILLTPDIVRDSLIVDWVLENYPMDLCYATDNNGEGCYYVYNGKYLEKDTMMSSRRFVEGKAKDLYDAYQYQLSNTEHYMTVVDEHGKEKEVETPEYKAIRKRLKDAEKYLDSRHQKDLWELLKTRITRKVREFDTDKSLLCLNNGVYNLKEHRLISHNAKYNMSLIAPVDYDPAATCPKFIELLNFQFPTVEEQRFIRYIYGGSLLREVRKTCSNIYHFGIRDSGKSTIALTVCAVLGNETGYSITRNSDFNSARKAKEATRNDRIQTRNKALIVIDEVPKDEKQDSETIKSSSGGAARSDRGLYQANEVIEPTCTIINTCNELPPFDWDDDALVNRLILTKFERKLPVIDDTKAFYKFLYETEASGILNWLLEGVKDYQKNGAPPMPERFEHTKKEIVGDADKVAKYIRQWCVIGDNLKCRMTWAGFNMKLETYLTNVERIDKKFHPGRKKIMTTLYKFGVVFVDGSIKPVKVNGTTARNVLLGIREKTPDELSKEEDLAWKEESEQLHNEMPAEIIKMLDKLTYKAAEGNQISEMVKVPLRYLLPVLEAMVNRGQLNKDGPTGYVLPLAPKPAA